MEMQVESRERTGYDYVSTGRLPSPEMVKSLVSEAYERFKSNAEGCSSDVYEALTRVPSDLFGVCVVGTSGNVRARASRPSGNLFTTDCPALPGEGCH